MRTGVEQRWGSCDREKGGWVMELENGRRLRGWGLFRLPAQYMMLMAAGYTPLHMAVGYSRTATVQVLLDFGADPEVADKEGRNVVELVEKLRAAMPLTPELLGRRTMLENVAGVLTGGLQTKQGLHSGANYSQVVEQRSD